MLEVKNIKKSYGDKVVLKNLNISLKNGEIYGLIGSNGAGKTTLFNIIAQVLKYDDGAIFIDDKKINNIAELSHKIGYIIDIPALFDYMTPIEYLDFLFSDSNFSTEIKTKKINDLLSLVGLFEVRNKRIRTFSRGMKQRMGIASGLIFEPDLIIMDEPSSALDPEGRMEVLNIILSLKEKGKTIILSTHILNDIERVCDRIGLLIDGEIKVEGSVSSILKQYTSNILKIVCEIEDLNNLKDILEKNNYKKKLLENSIEVEFKDIAEKKDIIKHIVNNNCSFEEISIKKFSLEEIFFKINKEGKK